MDDGRANRSDWGWYLRRMTSRPGWSIARLAREAGVHRATIFEWIKDGGESVTIASVRAIARALGDDLENALRAAANLESSPEGRDEEIELILSAPVGPEVHKRMLARLLELRERDRQQRLHVLRWLVEATDPEVGHEADVDAEVEPEAVRRRRARG